MPKYDVITDTQHTVETTETQLQSKYRGPGHKWTIMIRDTREGSAAVEEMLKKRDHFREQFGGPDFRVVQVNTRVVTQIEVLEVEDEGWTPRVR